MVEVAAAHPEAERVALWFQDEARVGRKGRVTRVWYERGRRPRGVRDLGSASASLFGAVCPERDTGCALVLPRASTAAMSLLLAEVSRALAPATHAVMVLDQAGWHTATDLAVPPNLTLVPLPAYAPELNGSEKVWQYLRARSLSQRVFRDLGESLDACGAAWNRLLAEPGRLRSLTAFPWLPLCVTSS